MKRLIVWFNPNNKTYYYKIVKTYYVDYFVGYKNSYNHEVVLVIDNLYFEQKRTNSLKKRLIKKIIRFLNRKL